MSLPDRDAILAFIRQTPGAVGKRELARAFSLHGEERDALKALLREMEEEGLLSGGPGRSLSRAGHLPHVAMLVVLEAVGSRVVAEPERWDDADGPKPRVAIAMAGGGRGRAGPPVKVESGDRILTRISGEHPKYLGSIIKRLGRGHARLMGVVQQDAREGLMLVPVDKRERRRWPLHHASDVPVGELVRAELKGSGARTHAVVLERLGSPMHAKSLSAIAIAAKGIPDEFPDGVEEEAVAVSTAPLSARQDWTHIPFICIDPVDARDHDDAVWAEALADGSFRLIVAIADVSAYVRPGSALDRSAFDRGNSVYFPDQVVPMLPHSLSSGACSLKAGADKAVLACVMDVAADGSIRRHSFHRARVRIAENLAYEAAQAMADAGEGPIWANMLAPLWACWSALKRARAKRAPLALDLPERRVVLDDKGDVLGVAVRERLDAHMLIEDMMIAANVTAAAALEAGKAPVMYRCHEAPGREKLSSLKDYLATMGIPFALGQVITPATFNRVIALSADRTELPEIMEAVLRAQTQAYYAPRNTGHFGLSLASYAHFTSPIRRYADICVHRALVSACKLGEGGLPDGADSRFAAIGEHISFTERRAMEAERETLDRYVARHLAAQVGQILRARISGVQAFGFFATVDGIGGDGLVPVSALGEERFRFDEAGRFLEGVETATRYAVGQRLELRLEDAEPVTGSLRFSIPGVAGVGARPRFRRDGQRDGQRDGKAGPGRSGPGRGGPPPGVRRGRRS